MLFRKSNKEKAAKKQAAAAPAAPAPAKAKPKAKVPSTLHRKPTADLYTVLLVLSLIAVIVGIVFLWMEMALYDNKFKGGPSAGMVHGRPAVMVCSHDVAVTLISET